MSRFRWFKRAVCLSASLALLTSAGCGRSSAPPLASATAAPGAPGPSVPKKPARPGVSASPEVLPGQAP